jgi:hypothetical protein
LHNSFKNNQDKKMGKSSSTNFFLAIISAIFFKISSTHISLLWKFTAYTTSYIHLKQDWVTIHYGVINSPLYLMTTKLIGPVGGFMEKTIGGKHTIIFGGITILVSLLCLYIQQNIWVYYCITILLGIGVGSCNQICLKNLCLYKPNCKGFLLSCIGVFTTVFHGIFFLASEKYINIDDYALNKGNDNQFYPEYISQRYQKFILFSIFSFFFATVLTLLFYREYQYDNEEISNDNISQINNNNNNTSINSPNINESTSMIHELSTTISDFNVHRKIKEKTIKKINKTKKKNKFKNANYRKNMKKIIKSSRFWFLAIYTFLSPFVSYLTMSNFKNFRILIYSVSFNRFIGATIGLIKLIVAPLIGLIVDKYGAIYILRILCLLRLTIGILMSLFLNNSYFLFILALASEVSEVTQKYAFTPYLYNIFGFEYSIEIQGMIGIGDGFSNLFSAIMSFLICYFTQQYSFDSLILPYRYLFLFGSLLSIISFVLLLFENEEKFHYEDNYFNYQNLKSENNIIRKIKEFKNVNIQVES